VSPEAGTQGIVLHFKELGGFEHKEKLRKLKQQAPKLHGTEYDD
jgi:hypothetical protein